MVRGQRKSKKMRCQFREARICLRVVIPGSCKDAPQKKIGDDGLFGADPRGVTLKEGGLIVDQRGS